MVSNKYIFCGCSVELKTEDKLLPEGEFSKFRSDFSQADYSIDVMTTQELPLKNGDEIFVSDRRKVYSDGKIKMFTSYYNSRHRKYVDFACKIDDSVLYVSYRGKLRELTVFDGVNLPDMLLKKGIGILHCSFIEYNGGAILFAGDKQVGKSTQAALWKKCRNADIINGDRAGLKIENGKVFAYGVPFCGTSKICENKKLPIRAIVCLSKGTENRIERLLPLNAFVNIIEKFTYEPWRNEAVEQIHSLVGTIAENVPVYDYSCVKDKSAVDFLERELSTL